MNIKVHTADKSVMYVEYIFYCTFLFQVSVTVGHKTLFLYDMENPDNPIELAFQQRYGDIVTYKW